ADRNRSHWSTSKTPSYTKSVSWQHHPILNHSQWILAKEHYRYAQDTHDQRNQISDGAPGFKRRDQIR
ncbi:hypothetical protein C6A54_08090, partial [Escherichia coli]